MEAIAREAGVTKPIVYRLFGDRDGLLRALGERMAGEVVTKVIGALEQASDDDPKQRLRMAIDAYVAMIDHDTEVYRFVTEQAGTTRGGTVTGLSAGVARALADLMGDRLEANGADAGAAETWAFGIVGMVHLSGDWWVRNRTIARDQLVTYLVDLLWTGFTGPLPAPTERTPTERTPPSADGPASADALGLGDEVGAG